MARKSVKSVTYEDVVKVQNLIERCMQLYMSPKEVVNSLLNEAKIEPELTETVWQKLEEQNPKFFQAYYKRIALKQQIEEFNKLLHKQKQLMESEQAKVASLPTSNGFNYHAVSSLPSSNGAPIPAITENPTCYYVSAQTAEGLNPKTMQHGLQVEPNLSCVFNDDRSSFGMVNMSAQGDFSSMHYSQNSNLGFQQGVNGRMTISEPKYSSSSPQMFGADGNVMEAVPNVGNASATPIFNNGISSFGMIDWSAHGDIPSIHYSKNSNMRMQQGINRGMSIHEREYSSSSPHMFGADGNVMEAGPNVGNASATPVYDNGGSSFGMVDLSSHGDIPSMPNSKNSNMRLQQGSNGGMTISQPGFSSSSSQKISADGNIMEAGPNIGNASATPVYDNGGSSFGMVDMSAHGDIPSMPYSKNSNKRFQPGINGGMTISEPGYSSSSPHMFGADGNVVEAGPNVGNASSTPIFNNGGSSFGHGDIPSMPYSKNSNMCLQQGSNGGMTLSEPGYSSPSLHMFGADGDVMEAGPNVGNASASPVYDNGGSSFGHGDIPSMPYSQYSNMDSHSVVMEASPNVGCASAAPITSAESKSHSVVMEAGSNVGHASAKPITSNESNSLSVNEEDAVMDLLDTSSDLLDTSSDLLDTSSIDFWTRDGSYPDLASLFSDEIDDSDWPSFQNFALHNFPEIPKIVEQEATLVTK